MIMWINSYIKASEKLPNLKRCLNIIYLNYFIYHNIEFDYYLSKLFQCNKS